jgi:hypothetical protein
MLIDEGVTVITDGERIEGCIPHMDTVRLSDYLNLQLNHVEPFLKLKDSIVFCRRTGAELDRAPFLLVARNRIVIVMTESEHGKDSLADREAHHRIHPSARPTPASWSTPTS